MSIPFLSLDQMSFTLIYFPRNRSAYQSQILSGTFLDGGTKVYLQDPGHMIKMVAMSIYS